MQLHKQWQEVDEPESVSGASDSLLSVNGIANAEQAHETLQRSFRVTGNRICLNLKKHGYTSMDAAGRYHGILNFVNLILLLLKSIKRSAPAIWMLSFESFSIIMFFRSL